MALTGLSPAVTFDFFGAGSPLELSAGRLGVEVGKDVMVGDPNSDCDSESSLLVEHPQCPWTFYLLKCSSSNATRLCDGCMQGCRGRYLDAVSEKGQSGQNLLIFDAMENDCSGASADDSAAKRQAGVGRGIGTSANEVVLRRGNERRRGSGEGATAQCEM